ncbi:trichoplein keratin filament-binding protein [Corythoichthys intestinalis]|uniref:trichoplein keratin filament-binding protein n=1 Tax=Corythoichthys intestinalis TaxID=161448 RepID=UPI0025A4FBBE|nr:trichoplein keratin filament-binding protein [Corythoichthys intestinalis]
MAWLSTFVPYRRQPLSVQLAWKKELQCRRQEQLALNAKYLREECVRNHFYNEWTSRHSFEQSMSAYCKQKLEDEKMDNLEQRRIRLRDMLKEEQKQHEMELKQLQSRGGAMLKKTEEQDLLRGERRKKLAQELLKEHRKRTNPILQQVETRSPENVNQLPVENEREMTPKEDLEKMEHSVENEDFEERKREELLQKKMEELKRMEEEATRLKADEETLQIKLWELDKLELERKKFEERHKMAQMRRFLTRQYRAQLRSRAQQVQEELDSDFKILSTLLKGEQDVRIEGTRRERIFADAAWMKQVIEEQLQLEREREAEFDLLHREEAQRVWEKREATWEHERKARELLMHQVLSGRRKQMEVKMQKNREAQMESLRKRDELIQELEKANELRRQERELKHQESEREKRRQAEQAEEQLQEQCRIEEIQDEMDSQLSQEALLKQSIVNRAFQPRIHARPRVAWT